MFNETEITSFANTETFSWLMHWRMPMVKLRIAQAIHKPRKQENNKTFAW